MINVLSMIGIYYDRRISGDHVNLISSNLIIRCCSVITGEDGCEMSAAGQMETVLGVLGLEKVIVD